MTSSRLRALARSLFPVSLLLSAGCFGGSSGDLPPTGDDGGPPDQSSSQGALVGDPASEDFGTVNVGAQSASAKISFRNAGSGSIGPISVSLGTGDADSFGIDSDGCTNSSLSGGAACTVQVHFAPRAAGSKASKLTVSGSGATAVVPLTGTASAPPGALAVAPATKDFGDQPTGTTSATSTFTLSNGGAGPTGNVSVSLTGADKAAFSLTDPCSGKPLAAGASCAVTVAFAPTATGSKAATLTATADGVSGTVTASLAGTGTAPAAFAITPASHDFGSILEGTATPEQTFTVQNQGGTASGTPSVAVSGANASDFTISSNGCTAAVPAGGKCTFGVTFKPSTASAESASVAATAPSTTEAKAAVTGTGLAAAAVEVSPATNAFGQQVLGTTGTDVAFVVTNHGGVATGALKATLGGSNAAEFALGTDGCTGKTLAPAATCTVNVHFAPPATAAAGNVQATLEVAGTPGGTASSALTGVAVAPATLAIGPTSQAFGTVVQGQSGSDVPFTVTNSGGVASGALKATLGGTGAAQYALGTDGCSGKTLAAGATCTVNVHFSPAASAVGVEQATLTVAGTPGGSPSAALTGTAATPAAITIGPSTQSFGVVLQGTTTPDTTFTVTNSGGVATGALAVSLGGANPGQFGLGADTCAGKTLAPKATCTIAAHFSPAASTTGTQTATLNVSGTPGGSAPATLSGTSAPPPHLVIQPPAAFPGFKAEIGQTQSATFTLSNTSALPSGKPTITAGGDFTIPAASNGCTAAVGTTPCTFVLTYAPTSPSSAATLTASATPGGPATYALTGVGTSPLLSIDATTWAPSTSKGTPATKTFTITNKGTAPTAALKATLTGGPDLAMTNGCTQALNPASTCQVTLTFAATADEAVSGTLSVVDTAADTVSVAVSGGAGMVIAPASWDFGAVAIVGPYPPPASFTLTNYGSQATISSMSYPADDLDWFSPTDTCAQKTLAQGGTCTITFSCHPLEGVKTDTMQVLGLGANSAQITNTLTAKCASK